MIMYGMNIIILGCTSNICKIRVFENLNRLIEKINKIYCVCNKEYDNIQWIQYINNLDIQQNNLKNKVEYVKCEYTLSDYTKKIYKYVDDKTYIYVSTPPICYPEILKFFHLKNQGFVILEKPLSLNYDTFTNNIKPLLTDKIILMDHFLYKKDVQFIINQNIKNIKSLKFIFLYEDDLENRLGYFDKVGFFIDMFQTHLLSILYELIGDKINLIFESKIDIHRKQYNNYGGSNLNAETYFNLDILNNEYYLSIEVGKSMKYKKKQIIVNDQIFVINDYQDEYYNFFTSDKSRFNIINQQDLFWKITEAIKLHFKPITRYEKNKFIGNQL